MNTVPPSQLNRLVIIGDLNVDTSNKGPSKIPITVLKTLCKELDLKILEPEYPTYGLSRLDIAIVPKNLDAKIRIVKSCYSDYLPIILEAKLELQKKDEFRIEVPNRKLATQLTLNALHTAKAIKKFLNIFDNDLKVYKKRSFKRIKKRDRDKKLFALLTQNHDIDVKQTIKQYWNDLLIENEKLIYSDESSRAFQDLARFSGYKKFELRDGGIANCVKVDDKIITDPSEVNKALKTRLKISNLVINFLNLD